MKDKYIYPAIFHTAEEGEYWIEFPDLPMANTQGEDLEDALYMAKDCLGVYLSCLEEENEKIPNPTIPFTDISELNKGDFIQLIEVYMVPYRDEYKNEMERKNVTIPRWLNDIVKEKKINCSAVLVTALKEKLGISF